MVKPDNMQIGAPIILYMLKRKGNTSGSLNKGGQTGFYRLGNEKVGKT